MGKPEYHVGDRVWLAVFRLESVERPCSVCAGKREVTVIFGNGDSVVVPCEYCGKGYMGPRGVELEYEWVTAARQVEISGVETRETAAGTEQTIRVSGGYSVEDRVCATEAEALSKAEALAAQDKHERETSATYTKKNQFKNYSWNAGYHLRQAKDLLRRAEYHEKMAKICKAKSKEPDHEA